MFRDGFKIWWGSLGFLLSIWKVAWVNRKKLGGSIFIFEFTIEPVIKSKGGKGGKDVKRT